MWQEDVAESANLKDPTCWVRTPTLEGYCLAVKLRNSILVSLRPVISRNILPGPWLRRQILDLKTHSHIVYPHIAVYSFFFFFIVFCLQPPAPNCWACKSTSFFCNSPNLTVCCCRVGFILQIRTLGQPTPRVALLWNIHKTVPQAIQGYILVFKVSNVWRCIKLHDIMNRISKGCVI